MDTCHPNGLDDLIYSSRQVWYHSFPLSLPPPSVSAPTYTRRQINYSTTGDNGETTVHPVATSRLDYNECIQGRNVSHVHPLLLRGSAQVPTHDSSKLRFDRSRPRHDRPGKFAQDNISSCYSVASHRGGASDRGRASSRPLVPSSPPRASTRRNKGPTVMRLTPCC